jgi:hypothetical protein
MTFAAATLVFSIIIATFYGVIFSSAYPLVRIDGSLISLFAILGLATVLIVAGLWRAIRKPTAKD